MKREWAVGMLVLAVVLAVLVHCTGCLSQQAKEAIADGAYATEHMKCVDDYDTRAEIDACRRAVRVRWGITETGRDAGHD
jgi:hypothetical protein